jgi:hypothetical protein
VDFVDYYSLVSPWAPFALSPASSLLRLGVSNLSRFALKGKRNRSVCDKEGTLRVLMRVPLQCTRSVRSHAKSLGDTQRSWKVGLGCGRRRVFFVCFVGDVAGKDGLGKKRWRQTMNRRGGSYRYRALESATCLDSRLKGNETEVYVTRKGLCAY